MSSTRERAWLAAHQKGSKALVQRLDKAHANNPEYQAFKKKHGLGDTSSVKQVSKSQVDVKKEKARQALAAKAYGATKGTRMGSAEGTGETLRDTIAPLTRDQHSAVKAAEKAAKPAAAPKPAKPKKEKAAAPEKKKPSALELIAAAAAKRKINQPPVSAKALRRIAAVGDMDHDHGGFDDLSDTEYGGRGNRSIDEGMLDDYIEGKIEAHHRAKSKEDLAKSDAAREALSKKITPLNKKIASIKGSVTYKNKEHPRHSVAAEKLKTVRAERAAISAEREKHYNAFAKTRTARDEKIASDTKTYRNFGLVGLGLKKLKQKLTSEESVDEGWFSKKPKQSDMLDDGKGTPAPQVGKKLNVPSGPAKVDPIVSPTKMKKEEVEQIDEISAGKKIAAGVTRLAKGTAAAVVHAGTTPMVPLSGVPGENKIRKIGDVAKNLHYRAYDAAKRNLGKGVKNIARAIPEEVEQIDEITITNVTPPRGLPGKSSAEMGKKYREAAKKWDAENPPGKFDPKEHMKKVLANLQKEENVNEMDSEGYKGYRDDDVTKATHKATPITRKAMAKAALKALKGTPVVSLADVSEPSDYKKDKYGRTVPKKLAADDPRVKYHKEEVEQIDEANMRFDYEAAARPKSSDVKNFLNRDKNRRAAAASKKYIRRMTKLGGLGPNQTKKDTEAHMKAYFEEVEQIDEMKYGIGTVVKLKKPIDGHEFATVKGFTSSGSTRGPTGRGVPMPAGNVKKVKVALRKSDDHSYYAGPITHIEHGDVHSVIRESAPGWMLKQDPELAKKVEAKKKLAKKRQEQMGNQTPVREAKHHMGGALFADTAARLQKAIDAHKQRMDQITSGPEDEYHHPTLNIKTKSRVKLPAPWAKVEDK